MAFNTQGSLISSSGQVKADRRFKVSGSYFPIILESKTKKELVDTRFGTHVTSAGSKGSKICSATRISLQSLPSSNSAGYDLLVTVTEQQQSPFIVFSTGSQHMAKRVGGQHRTFVNKTSLQNESPEI